MNKDSRKIRIYLKIIDFLVESNRREYYPKVTDILKQLEKSDITTSVRSIQRYLSDLNNDFAIYIDKKGKQGGYQIMIDEITNFNEIYETFRILEKADYFKDVITKSKDALQYVSFDGKQFTGYHNIETILDAILRNRVIKITHKKFDSKETERKVKPYILKEYNNRWYLIGYDYNSKEIRTFGLDRIEKALITQEEFDNSEAISLKKKFKSHIGLVNNSTPEEVCLKFGSNQIGYFRTYPWHESAEIEQNEKGEWIVHMFISINYELQQLILMNHAFVQVLKPKHLADSVKYMMTKALEKYS